MIDRRSALVSIISSYTFLIGCSSNKNLNYNNTKIQSDEYKAFCTNDQRALNADLCKTLDFRHDILKNLPLAAITGAAAGSVLGELIVGNSAAGALIGSVALGSVTLAKNYLDFKIKENNMSLKMALMSIDESIKYETYLLDIAINDLNTSISNFRNEINSNLLDVNSKINLINKQKLISINSLSINNTFINSRKSYKEIKNNNNLLNSHKSKNEFYGDALSNFNKTFL